MTPARYIALGASLVGAAYATGLGVGHLLFRRSVLYPKESA
jgi:hypothetical protein